MFSNEKEKNPSLFQKTSKVQLMSNLSTANIKFIPDF